MRVQNGERLATKQDLADMYQGILPYLGGMPEMVANKFSKGDLYSTDEKMIGQWTDGKPLYQKVFDLGILPSGGKDGAPIYALTGIDNALITSYFQVNPTTGAFKNQLPMIPPTAMGWALTLDIRNQNGVLNVCLSQGASSTGGNRLFANIQYTKSTDSPISIGNDTDYSTDEKIIGTWIDGSPVYQCTFEVNNPSTDWSEIILANKSVSYVHKVGVEFYRGGIFTEFFNSTSDFVSCAVFAGSNLACRIKQAGNSGITKAIFTIQYTKTTD